MRRKRTGKFYPIGVLSQFSNKSVIMITRTHFRTFLTTVEIVVICVFTVLFVIFMALLTVYLCMYGCVLPACCR